MEIIHGVPCIKGEIHSLITLIRLNTRWSTRSSSHRRQTREASPYEEEDALIQSFRRLNEYLEGLFDLQEVNCVSYITPFHEVVVSSQGNGPLTSAALSALSKFALYGFFNSKFPHIREGMALVASSIAHCVFEETDWESDELILMKLLELSALCFRCNASDELSVHSAWEIYCTCLSIHNHYRASKILKSEAETALVHLTLSIFNRASSISTRHNLIRSMLPNIPQTPLSEYTEQTLLSTHTGIVVMLLKIMRVLAEMLETPKQSTEHIKFALFLINVSLEAGGPALNGIPNVVAMLSDDICRHLLRSSQSDDLGVFSSSLRVVFNLFMSIKDHMKVQLEVFLSSVHLRLLNSGNTLMGSAAREELVLESLLDFCREPSLMHDLYTNYDCDVQCSNLFDSIIDTLCRRAVLNIANSQETNEENDNSALQLLIKFQEGLNTPLRLTILHRLSFDGLLAVLHAIVGKYNLFTSSSNGRNDANDDADEENVEVQVDRWCETASEPELLSQEEEYELFHCTKGDQSPSAASRLAVEGDVTLRDPSPFMLIPRVNSMSDTRSEQSAEDLTAGSVDGAGPSSVVDRENERTGAIREAKAKATEMLRQRKTMKQKLKVVVEEFNAKPLKPEWMKLAIDAGILSVQPVMEESKGAGVADVASPVKDVQNVVSAAAVAHFLRHTPGLGKTQVGEYISKGPPHLFPFHAKVLKEYAKTFDFSGECSTFDKALRLFLSCFRLPGEAQCIDRIMEAFSADYFVQLGANKPFASADAAFILSFSTIMLNTDLHNPQIPANKKMTKEEFIRNNRGINDNQDLPRDYLCSLYDEIKAKQIQVDIDVSDAKAANNVDITDPTVWNKLIHKQQQSLAPALFTPTGAARKQRNLSYPYADLRSVNVNLFGIRDSSTSSQATSDDSITPLTLSALMSASKQEALLMSTYEVDMFLAMCKPVHQTMSKLWSQTLDDYWLSRLLQGSLEFFAACSKLGLDNIYCRTWRMQMRNACQWMTKCRSLRTKPLFRSNILASRSSYEQWRGETGHDLLALAGASVEQLVMYPSQTPAVNIKYGKKSASNLQTDRLDWSEGALIKGELTFKLLLSVALQAPVLLDGSSWAVLFAALLWSRSRGSLPSDMATVCGEFAIPISKASKMGGSAQSKLRFPASMYLHRCLSGSGELDNFLLSTVCSSVNNRKNLQAYGISSKQSIMVAAVAGGSVRATSDAAVRAPTPQNESTSTAESGWMSWVSWSSPTAPSPTQILSSSVKTEQPIVEHGRTVIADGMDAINMAGFNTNSMESADRAGCPLRPDDAVLCAVLDHSDTFSGLFGTDVVKEEVKVADARSPVGIMTPVIKSKKAPADSIPAMAQCSNAVVSGLFLLLQHLLRAAAPQLPPSSVRDICESSNTMMMKGAGVRQEEDEVCRSLDGAETVEEMMFQVLQTNSHASAEVNLVLCMEWLAATVCSTNFNVWSKYSSQLLKTLHWVLAEEADVLATQATAFLDRCIFYSLKGIVQSMLHRKAEDDFWSLLPHLVNLPADVLTNCAPMISAGVLAIIKSAQVCEGKISAESWGALLTLLLMAVTDPSAAADIFAKQNYSTTRNRVWQTVVHVFSEGLVCEDNFLPLRTLLLKIVSKYAAQRRRKGELESDAMNEAQELQSIDYLWKMSLIAWTPFVQISTPTQQPQPSVPASPVKGRGAGLNPPRSPTKAPATPITVTFPASISCPSLTQQSHAHAAAPKSKSPTEGFTMHVVQTVRHEHAQKLWLETSALLADLCWADSAQLIDCALVGLEHLVAAETALNLPAGAVFVLLEELVNRLPLNIVTATGRQQAALSHAEIVAACFRSANIIFHIFTRYARMLRTMEHYNSLFIRAISALVTNASVSPRTQSLHEEMLGMAVALLRLLRLPVYATAAVEQPSAKPGAVTASAVQSSPAAAAPAASSGYSIWSLFGLAASPEPVKATASAVVKAADPPQQDVAMLSMEHDRDLLCLAWKTASSLYSLFPGLIKAKDPQLHATLMHCMDTPPPAGSVAMLSPARPLAQGTQQAQGVSTHLKGRSPPPRAKTISTVQVV